MTPERLEEIRRKIDSCWRDAMNDESEPFTDACSAASELLAAYEALAPRKVIHEETRRVWRFDDGSYPMYFRSDDKRTIDHGETDDYFNAANVLPDSKAETYCKRRGGRPVTIKITVEEVE